MRYSKSSVNCKISLHDLIEQYAPEPQRKSHEIAIKLKLNFHERFSKVHGKTFSVRDGIETQFKHLFQ